jgi:zinc/manganese transport system substrate-binding protein
MSRICLFLVVLACTLMPSGPACASTDTPLKVVASFSILADWVRIVGAGDVSVTALVGADADAHVYEPTPADLVRVSSADVLVVNGLGFEGWMTRLASAAQFRGTTVIASQGIRARTEQGVTDPHAWHDLRNAERYVLNIAQALAALRPAAAERFSSRANRYVAALRELDAQARRSFDAIPRNARVAVIAHDAFGYLADAYDLQLLPALGMSTDSEPSAATVANLIRQIRTHRARAVFVENIRDPRLIERIAAEGGVKLGGRLYSDALGPPGSPASNYIDLYRHNIGALVYALSQTVFPISDNESQKS